VSLLGDAAAVIEWGGAVGGLITVVGGAGVGLWYLFRSKRVELAKESFAAQREETAAVTAAEKVKRDEAFGALGNIIEDLRGQVERQSERYEKLQSSVISIRKADIRDMDEVKAQLHECEKRHAVLESKYADMQTELDETRKRLWVLEHAPPSDR
jgi:uncharacterized protein YhaN